MVCPVNPEHAPLALLTLKPMLMSNKEKQSEKGQNYPGVYVPIINERAMASDLKLLHEGDTASPPLNLIESSGLFLIEMAVPGAKREDFLINTVERALKISLLCKKNEDPSRQYKLHEFNYECFSRTILLPENVDPEMITAKYDNGLLQLYIPKGLAGIHAQDKVIPVY